MSKRRYVAQGPRYIPPIYTCQVCGTLANYGTAVRLSKGIAGQWWCRAHLPPAGATPFSPSSDPPPVPTGRASDAPRLPGME
jgi:hypothetical protein